MTLEQKQAFIKEYKELCLKHNCLLSWKSNHERHITYLKLHPITYASNIDYIDGVIAIDDGDAPIYKR